MGLLAPAEGINYDFILGMYSFFLALGALFAGLEFVMGVEAVKGFYLVFAPFVPAFMWCTVVRSAWLERSKESIKSKSMRSASLIRS